MNSQSSAQNSKDGKQQQTSPRCMLLAACFGLGKNQVQSRSISRVSRSSSIQSQNQILSDNEVNKSRLKYDQESLRSNYSVKQQQQQLSRESLKQKNRLNSNSVDKLSNVKQYLNENVEPQRQNQLITGTFSRTSKQSKEESEPWKTLKTNQSENSQAISLFGCFGISKVSDDQEDDESDLIGVPYGQNGLINNGNTCFMNSAIQCLRCTPNFLELLEGQYQNRRLVLLLPNEQGSRRQLREGMPDNPVDIKEKENLKQKQNRGDQLSKIGQQGAYSEQILNSNCNQIDINEYCEDPISFKYNMQSQDQQNKSNELLDDYLAQQKPMNPQKGDMLLFNQVQNSRQLLNGGNMKYYTDQAQQNLLLSKTLEDKTLPSVKVSKKIFDTEQQSDSHNSNFSERDQVMGRSLSETAQLMKDRKLKVILIENPQIDFRQKDTANEIFGKSIIDTLGTAEQLDFGQLVSKTHNTIHQINNTNMQSFDQLRKSQGFQSGHNNSVRPDSQLNGKISQQANHGGTTPCDQQYLQKFRFEKSITETFLKLNKEISSPQENKQIINPQSLFNRLSKHPLGQELCDGGQHDSQEFLNILLNCMHVELKKGEKSACKEDQPKSEVDNKLISQQQQLRDSINSSKLSNKFQLNQNLKASMKDMQDDFLDFIHNSAQSQQRALNTQESQRKVDLGDINKSSQSILQLSRNTSRLELRDGRESIKEYDDNSNHDDNENSDNKTSDNNSNSQEAAVKSWDEYLSHENSLITELFSGQFESTIVCHKCNTKTIRHEIFQELMIPIQREKKGGWLLYKHSISLEEMVRVFTQGEEMKDKEAYFCEKCKSKQTATKKIQISRFPKVLVIQLLRSKEKLHHLVKFPLNNLDMSQFSSQVQNMVPENPVHPASSLNSKESMQSLNMLQKSQTVPTWPNNQNGSLLGRLSSLQSSINKRGSLKKEGENESLENSSMPQENQYNIDNSSYNLYGVINHYGSMQQGHYTSYCKIKKQRGKEEWYSFNDSYVSKQAADRVVTSSAYMLFYVSKDFINSQRKDTKRGS